MNQFVQRKNIGRESNIELLRILAALGVIVLHFNGAGGGMELVKRDSLNDGILQAMQCIFRCAVNVFVLISGYFLAVSKKRDLLKPLQMVFQVSLFSVVIYLISTFVGNGTFSIPDFLKRCLPVNWFVMLYIALYIISPYLNKLMEMITEKERGTFLLILIILFSVYPTLVDLLENWTGTMYNGLSTISISGSLYGYTIINFVLVYLIGYMIREYEERLWRIRWGGIFLCTVAVNYGTVYLSRYFGTEESIAHSYCNPLVILEAVSVFMLFRKMKMGNHVVINRLAKASFTVYILHAAFIPYMKEEFLVNSVWYIMIGGIFFGAVVVYLISWIADEIYHLLVFPLDRLISRKWIHYRQYEIQ